MIIASSIKQLNEYNSIDDIEKFTIISKNSLFKNFNLEFGPIEQIFDTSDWKKQIIDYKNFCVSNDVKLVSAHAPYINNFCFGVTRKKEIQLNVKRIKKSIISCNLLNIKLLVLHIGCSLSRDLNVDYNQSLKDNIKVLSPILKFANKNNVKIAIENNTNFKYNFMPTIQFLQMLKLKLEKRFSISFCFDTGHFNMAKHFNKSDYRDIMNDVSILHVHNNYRNKDSHDSLGNGTFNFGKLFRCISKDDIIVMSEVRYNKQEFADKKEKCLNETFQEIQRLIK